MRRVECGILGTVFSLIALAFVVPAVGQSDSAAKASAGKSTGGADHNVPQVRRINEEISRVWDDNKLRPSPPATDGEWCRRVYLDVLGRVPSVQELREFLTS